MINITGITTQPSQVFRVPFTDGELIQFRLIYRPSVQMWFLSIDYKNFSVAGVRVCNSVNIISQFCNIIPFGVFISVQDESEPLYINDFIGDNPRVSMSILEKSELDEIEEILQS